MKAAETKLCECGCGSPAPLSQLTDIKRGYVKGQPMRFIWGHNRKGHISNPNLSTLQSTPQDQIKEISPGVFSIPLTQGYAALVDAEDVARVAQFKWHVHFNGNNWYAIRHVRLSDGKEGHQRMHRFIMGLQFDDSRDVDHKDRDGLNNQKNNLRIATRSQNQHNQGLAKHNTSQFKGVSFDKSRNKWEAYIKLSGEQLRVGRFGDPIAAAQAYDEAARKYFGEFACVNFPRSGEQGALPPKEIAATAA